MPRPGKEGCETSFFSEVYAVAWSDIRFMRHNIVNILISSLMLPVLYLIAFGYGLNAQDVEVEGVTVPYIDFIIPGIIALTSLSSSFSSTSTRMNVQRLYYRSFDEMMMCPLGNSAIIIGKTVLGMCKSLLSCSLMFIIGYALEPSYMNLTPLLIISVLLSCFTFSLLGETAALLAKSHQSMATFSSVVITPMTFLCGTFFSVAALPEWAQALLYALPLTEASICIRSAALDIYSFPYWALGVLACFAAAFYLIDLYLIKNRKV
ncbi:ABC transporter [Candidatus Methanomethylophilus sp. 1R26]|uniref:ABC transporter permease n=1 Tax=Candidatus Methanomethylophilus sp. 1R26 TaxID=1769296 RepID=UPI0007378A70|nr:ABC transporter permease [Candidatus Methanomethylophilus sp. 1R26]KUE74407.1 ABC transporter [Candidatus Methanomethylophilus sp. 1R26]